MKANGNSQFKRDRSLDLPFGRHRDRHRPGLAELDRSEENSTDTGGPGRVLDAVVAVAKVEPRLEGLVHLNNKMNNANHVER